MRVLVAGATGYLGSHLARELQRRGVWVRALVRHPHQRHDLRACTDDIVIGQVTEPVTLRQVAADVDVVFSSIGITRQRDRLSYDEVDYQGNVNLLNEAIQHAVSRFVYVSIFHGPELRQLAMVDAKERFVAALATSGIPHTIIRPTGFFRDMSELLSMARRGAVILFGDGTAQINPISGHDLATACVDAIMSGEREIAIGGPEVFSYNRVAELAFRVLEKRARIWHVPNWSADVLTRMARRFAPDHLGGPLEFLSTVTRQDMVAPRSGQDTLEHFFEHLQAKTRPSPKPYQSG